MKSNKVIGPAVGLLAALTLGACGTMNDPLYGGSPAPSYPSATSGGYPANTYPVTTQPADTYPARTAAGYGVVHSVERVSQEPTAAGGSGLRSWSRGSLDSTPLSGLPSRPPTSSMPAPSTGSWRRTPWRR